MRKFKQTQFHNIKQTKSLLISFSSCQSEEVRFIWINTLSFRHVCESPCSLRALLDALSCHSTHSSSSVSVRGSMCVERVRITHQAECTIMVTSNGNCTSDSHHVHDMCWFTGPLLKTPKFFNECRIKRGIWTISAWSRVTLWMVICQYTLIRPAPTFTPGYF